MNDYAESGRLSGAYELGDLPPRPGQLKNGDTPHPAKFNGGLLDAIAAVMRRRLPPPGTPQRLLDPFAGTGRVCELAWRGFDGLEYHCNDLEREWVDQAVRYSQCGLSVTITYEDAARLSHPDGFFGAVVTSPCYGNRMADHHEASDTECGGQRTRNTYKHKLGRMPSEGSAAVLHWHNGPAGDDYRDLHLLAWTEAHRVLAPEGLMIVNIKDHIRKGQRQPVVNWHHATLEQVFGRQFERIVVPCPGNRQGANGQVRVDYEELLVGIK